jgi:hypothetical protein
VLGDSLDNNEKEIDIGIRGNPSQHQKTRNRIESFRSRFTLCWNYQEIGESGPDLGDDLSHFVQREGLEEQQSILDCDEDPSNRIRHRYEVELNRTVSRESANFEFHFANSPGAPQHRESTPQHICDNINNTFNCGFSF